MSAARIDQERRRSFRHWMFVVIGGGAIAVLFTGIFVYTSSTRIDARLGGDISTNPTLDPDESAVNKIPLNLPLDQPRILVSKSKRRLRLYSNDKLVRIYRIGLGTNPVDDKVKEGDRRTPEGEFYIFTKNDKSAYYLSLGLSYPNAEDAERGLRDGLITRRQYNQILTAIQNKTAPPQKTPLGGLIYIHGNGSKSDWTWGCVALDDKDMQELFDSVPLRTTVIIEQ